MECALDIAAVGRWLAGGSAPMGGATMPGHRAVAGRAELVRLVGGEEGGNLGHVRPLLLGVVHGERGPSGARGA
jgi:hypothetical protein